MGEINFHGSFGAAHDHGGTIYLFFGQLLICKDILNKSLPIMTFAIAAHALSNKFLHTFSKYISFLILFKYE